MLEAIATCGVLPDRAQALEFMTHPTTKCTIHNAPYFNVARPPERLIRTGNTAFRRIDITSSVSNKIQLVVHPQSHGAATVKP